MSQSLAEVWLFPSFLLRRGGGGELLEGGCRRREERWRKRRTRSRDDAHGRIGKHAEETELLSHSGTAASSWTSALPPSLRASGRKKNTVYFSVTKQFQGKRLQLFDNMTTKTERFDGKKTKTRRRNRRN